MNPDHPILLPTQHVRMALKMYSGSPDLIERILAGSGICPDSLTKPSFTFPIAALWPIADNLLEIYGEGWFLNLPILWSVEVQSEYGLAIRSANDVATALDVLEEFSFQRWQMGRAEGKRNRNHYILKFTPSMRFTQSHFQMATSLIMLNCQTTMRSIIGDDVSRLVFEMAGPAPSYEDRLAEFVAGSVSWGHDNFVLFVPADLLSQTPPMANDATFNMMTRLLREQGAQVQKKFGSVSPMVELALNGITRGQVTAKDVATKLGLSQRTMERRLHSEGTSFRTLLDASLRERFERLVVDEALSSSAIAERLGYNDATSLQRTCRRWYGKAFSAVRKDKIAGQ